MKHRQIKSQSGAVLIVSLIILLVMTVLGVTAMQSTVLEERMAGNFRDRHLAFQAAEAALRNGEVWINSQSSAPIPNATGSTGVWSKDVPDISHTSSLWVTSSTGVTTVNGLQMVATPPVRVINSSPKRIIEEIKFVNDGDITIGTAQAKEGNMQYRVTSRGTGGTDNAMVMAQSIFSQRY